MNQQSMNGDWSDPDDRKEPEEFCMETNDLDGCDCSDQIALLYEELGDYTESMARCHEEGWFYSDEASDKPFE